MISHFRITLVVPVVLLVASVFLPAGSTATENPSLTQAPMCNGFRVTLLGSEGDDDMVGTPERDVIHGFGGDDMIRGSGGDDVICGGSGRDTLAGGEGADYVRGDGSADVLRGGPGDDQMIDHYNERSWGDGAWTGLRNQFYDGPGSDSIQGRAKNPGGDVLSYEESAQAVSLNWKPGIARVGSATDRFKGMARIIGSEFDDLLIARDNPRLIDEMAGGAGNDELRGRRGPDRLTAGAPERSNDRDPHVPPSPGHDTVYGGPDDDILLPGGNQLEYPGDARTWSFGGRGSDWLAIGPSGGRAFGQVGIDRLTLHAHVSVRADLRTGDVTGVPLRSGGFERHRFDIRDDGGTRIIGSPRRDDIEIRSPKPLRVTGGAGNDRVDASNADNNGPGLVSGGDGDDDLNCRQPCDVNGGPGDDMLVQPVSRNSEEPNRAIRGGLGDDSLSGSTGPAYGGPGDDYVSGSGPDDAPIPLIGGRGDDVFGTSGDLAGRSRVDGGEGKDTVSGVEYSAPQDSPGLTIDLTEGSISTEETVVRLVDIENATGSRFDDTIVGDDTDNDLHGHDGTDSVDGRGGTDTCTAETVTNCEG